MSFLFWSWIVCILGFACSFLLGWIRMSYEKEQSPTFLATMGFRLLISLGLYLALTLFTHSYFPERIGVLKSALLPYLSGYYAAYAFLWNDNFNLTISKVGIIILFLIAQTYLSLQ